MANDETMTVRKVDFSLKCKSGVDIQSTLSWRAPLYNKSLSIKDSLIFPLMNSAYDFNLYIKATAHKKHIFRFPWVPFIYRFDYTVEFVYSEVQGTLDLSLLKASFVIRETM